MFWDLQHPFANLQFGKVLLGKDPVFLNQIEGLALHKYEKEIVGTDGTSSNKCLPPFLSDGRPIYQVKISILLCGYILGGL